MGKNTNTSSTVRHCQARPRQSRSVIVQLPNGVVVQATGLPRAHADPDPDFGLYLDRRWASKRLTWDHVILDWPDFGVPDDIETTHREIKDAYERAANGERVEIGCWGGVGRTGTVLGCMAVLAGVPAAEARPWVRQHYNISAIETEEQHDFVLAFTA